MRQRGGEAVEHHLLDLKYLETMTTTTLGKKVRTVSEERRIARNKFNGIFAQLFCAIPQTFLRPNDLNTSADSKPV